MGPGHRERCMAMQASMSNPVLTFNSSHLRRGISGGRRLHALDCAVNARNSSVVRNRLIEISPSTAHIRSQRENPYSLACFRAVKPQSHSAPEPVIARPPWSRRVCLPDEDWIRLMPNAWALPRRLLAATSPARIAARRRHIGCDACWA